MEPTSNERDAQRPLILIVAESVQDAEVVSQLFEALGAHVALAFGAVSAAKILRGDHPAMVFIDHLGLGGDRCHSVLEWLKGQDERTTSAIYVCLGRDAEHQGQRDESVDFDLYLEYPITSNLASELIFIAQRKATQIRPAAPLPAGIEVPGERPAHP